MLISLDAITIVRSALSVIRSKSSFDWSAFWRPIAALFPTLFSPPRKHRENTTAPFQGDCPESAWTAVDAEQSHTALAGSNARSELVRTSRRRAPFEDRNWRRSLVGDIGDAVFSPLQRQWIYRDVNYLGSSHSTLCPGTRTVGSVMADPAGAHSPALHASWIFIYL